MTTPEDRPDIDIDVDHAIWLVGPSPDLDDAERHDWIMGAQHAISTDLDLENAKGGADYREYVAAVLKVFARSSTQANVTFLRLRHQGDTPIPVLLELYSRTDLDDIEADPGIEVTSVGDSPGARFVAAMMADPDDVPTVGEISRERVGQSDWQRLVYWIEDADDGVTGRVRYVRHFETSGAVAVLRFGGLDPTLTVEALEDVDTLAQRIAVGGQA